MEKQLELENMKELARQIIIAADKLLTEYKTPIETLNFSRRLKNALKRNCIDYVEQLLKLNRKDLLRMRNFGIHCLNELTNKINSLGFVLQE